ncbi:hypothetical protein CCR75_006906 [Bremia lactucae]|uniref:Uncharacterized protein n=1 Tax=Bremia lactucae TaxID=4779 RepID=A0A976NXU0_BRELC|nr:hypothetical protein CCR75_006906 [Bremia lactucae]
MTTWDRKCLYASGGTRSQTENVRKNDLLDVYREVKSQDKQNYTAAKITVRSRLDRCEAADRQDSSHQLTLVPKKGETEDRPAVLALSDVQIDRED